MASSQYYSGGFATSAIAAARDAARMPQQSLEDGPSRYDEVAQSEQDDPPHRSNGQLPEDGFGYGSSNGQTAPQDMGYNSNGVSRALSNPKSYAGRMQTKPGLAIATSAQSGGDDLHMSPTSPTDTDYYAGRSPITATSTRPRKGSVTDRSPLQRLEGHLGDLTKEEKRARAEEAESQARQRGKEKITRKPVENAAARPETLESQQQKPLPRTPLYPLQTYNAYSPGRGTFSSDSRQPRVSSANYPSTGQPTSPTTNVLRSQSQRYGHDAALTGGAAAAALGAFQAVRQQKPLPPLPVTGSSTRTISRDVSSLGPPNEFTATSTSSQPVTAQSNLPTSQAVMAKPQVQSNRSDKAFDSSAVTSSQGPDFFPPSEVQTHGTSGPSSEVSPQIATDGGARRQAGFAPQNPNINAPATSKEDGRLHRIFHRTKDPTVAQAQGPAPLDEWKNAQTAELLDVDLDSDAETESDEAWWERSNSRSNGNSQQTRAPIYGPSYESSFESDGAQTSFTPPLFLRCGPLLRYSGIKVQTTEPEARASAVWTGSVMIVTEDTKSSYQTPPTLQLFKQSKIAFANPPKTIRLADGRVVPEYVDALAGQPKISRNGQTLFVKPVDQIKGEVDLSMTESNEGLFVQTLQTNAQARTTQKAKGGRIREIQGFRLHAERGMTFWRFNLKIHLRSKELRIAYRINGGPAVGFWVPALDQPMNIMFHSCNGFSLSVNPNMFSGPDPLWRDVLNNHQQRPFHVMMGGGDQLYNDAAMKQTTLFQEWLGIKNPEHKHSAKFTPEMRSELENFYLNRYAMWFSQGLFGMANSQIPMVNIWDDHDIMDGFGSYPHHFMSTPVFSGVGEVAFKYYMLFQHQSVPDETEDTESSWLLGASPGPYINQLSRSVFMSLGKGVAMLGLDCRTERMRDEVLTQETYDRVFERCEREIIRGKTKHLIVLLGIPIAYPRLNFLENILTSRLMDPLKALGRAGMLGGFVNKFDGGVEILDDLDDHWTAKHHKHERNWLIQELQVLAADKSVRVTILGGDVHLAAVGQFYSNKKLGITKDRDHRYMPNIISSAIVNTPPPEMMGDIINKRNKTHHLDKDTDEDMIPLFSHDVNGKPRNNVHLLPRRNWCSITPYQSSNAPPQTAAIMPTTGEEPRPTSRRSFSLTRRNSKDSSKPSMFRSFSNRNAPPSSYKSPIAGSGNPNSLEGVDPGISGPRASVDGQRMSMDNSSLQSSGAQSIPSRKNSFLRRRRSVRERNAPDINLEGGLSICINCEVDQKDPAGITQPYTLLVPALFYESFEDLNDTSAKGRVKSLFGTLKRNRKTREAETEGLPYEETRMPYQAPPGAQTVATEEHSLEPAKRSVQPAGYDEGGFSEDEDFQDAPEEHPMPAVVSNEPPIPQSRAVSNAMSQQSATQGVVIPDSSYQQPASDSAHGRSPSAEWGGLGGSSVPQSNGPRGRIPTQLSALAGPVNDVPERRSRAIPGPLTANPPTPSNAHFETKSQDPIPKSTLATQEQSGSQPANQSVPFDRPSMAASKSYNGQESPMESRQIGGAYGPPPPSNIENLPEAIKKRYSQYRRAPSSPSGPQRSQSYGNSTERRVQSGPSASSGPWQAQTSSRRDVPPQANGFNSYQETVSRNGPLQAIPPYSQPSTSLSSATGHGPPYQNTIAESQASFTRSSASQARGSWQPAQSSSVPAPASTWQPPRTSYIPPNTPPRDSRAMLHDEDALNDLLGSSNQTSAATKRTSGSHQKQQLQTTTINTLPPQQAAFPYPASQLQTQSQTQSTSGGKPPSMPMSRDIPNTSSNATSPPAQTTTTDVNTKPATITQPSKDLHQQTTYRDTDSESEISMPPTKPELFLQSRVPTSQQRDTTRGSKLARLFGGDAPAGYDGASTLNTGGNGYGQGASDNYGQLAGTSNSGRTPEKLTRNYDAQQNGGVAQQDGFGDGDQSQAPGSSGSGGFVGRFVRRLSEGGSGRRGNTSGYVDDGGRKVSETGSGWRRWR